MVDEEPFAFEPIEPVAGTSRRRLMKRWPYDRTVIPLLVARPSKRP